MTPGQQQRKDRQDDTRRQQQADEKVRELEEEIERLRGAVQDACNRFGEISEAQAFPHPLDDVRKIASSARSRMQNALDGGGDVDA